MTRIKRALISVSDKRELATIGGYLHSQGVKILSTGGTAKQLRELGAEVTEVSEHTGFPEIMDGRVKTLHPKIHGGLLGRRGTDDAIMADHGIEAIDLVIVNLYPFQETVAKPDCTLVDAIENIDIGGPAMLRAAAKNHADVAVVVDPDDYERVVADMKKNQGAVSDELRFELAAKAFKHTAAYDGAVSQYLTAAGCLEDKGPGAFPPRLDLSFERLDTLRYGENPHQQAAFYRDPVPVPGSLASATQHQGKALSYNNIADADAAWRCVRQFDRPTCVIVKHANPCGVSQADDLMTAYRRAYKTDSTSAFGGIIAFNQKLKADVAQAIIDQQFVELIIAPEMTEDALRALAGKKNVRVLSTGRGLAQGAGDYDLKRVSGGLLLQSRDEIVTGAGDLKIATDIKPSDAQIDDLLFSWKVVNYVKSNAIVFCADGRTLGVGAGQMSRVYSARIAAIKAQDANLDISGSVMASDAFFPFRDTIDQAAELGIKAIIQPGGSMRDQEVIDAANEHGLAMVFTGVRHFRH